MPPRQWMGHLRGTESEFDPLAVWGGKWCYLRAHKLKSSGGWGSAQLWPGFEAIEQRISFSQTPPLKVDSRDSREVGRCFDTILPSYVVWHNEPREKQVDKYGRPKMWEIFFQNVLFWTAQMKLFTKVWADRQDMIGFVDLEWRLEEIWFTLEEPKYPTRHDICISKRN